MEKNTPFVLVDASAEKTCTALGIDPDREIAIQAEINKIGSQLDETDDEAGRLASVANQVATNLGLNANELFLLGLAMGSAIGQSMAMEAITESMTSSFASLMMDSSEEAILPGTGIGEA